MKKRITLPQNSRLVAVLLGFVGGAIDVYCHLELHTLVALQTGNLILMAENFIYGDYIDIFYKFASIVGFTIGFLLGFVIRSHATTAFWRTYAIMPLLVITAIIPLVPQYLILKILLLAFGTGLVMLTFTGTKIESDPFTIMMTSGNYQKLLHAIQRYWIAEEYRVTHKRRIHNYLFVVGSFVIGLFITAIAYKWLGVYAIWLVTLSLLAVLIFYSIEIYLYYLERTDL